MDITSIGGDAQALQPQILRVGQHADGHEHLVEAGSLRHAVLVDGQSNPAGIGLSAGDARAGLHLDAVAVEGALQLLADLLVFVGNDARQELDDGYVGSIHAVDIGELDADCAASDDGNGAGDVLSDDALAAGDDLLTIHRERRDAARSSAGGDDDVAGGDTGRLPVGSGHVDGAGGNDASVSLDVIDAVLAEQERDAAGHSVHDLAAAFHCHRVVGVEVVEGQTELVGTRNVGYDFGVFEEGFGGDTTPVEANAAEGFSFDDAGLQPQLTGSNGGDIATRTAADYCYIIPCIGCHQSDQPTSLAQPANCQSR